MTRPAVPHRLAGFAPFTGYDPCDGQEAHIEPLRNPCIVPAEEMQTDPMTEAFHDSMNPWVAAAWGFVFGALAVVVLVECGL